MKAVRCVLMSIMVLLVVHTTLAQDRIAVSQVGFAPNAQKQFSSPVQFTSFEIKRVSDNATVFTGGAPVRQVTSQLIGGATVWIGDFSSFTTPGRYKIVAGGRESYPFNIGVDVFDEPARLAQRMFYYQRAFTAITMPYAEGPWVHPTDAHLAPAGVVKGWHDAGDYAVYMPTMAQSIFWMLETWSDFRPLADNTNIPESGNGIPDLLDEVRWGLEWVRSMQDANGGFWGVVCPGCSNSYYYGTSLPHTISAYCKAIPPTVQNTAKAVAVLAYASRVFAPYDASFASACLASAQAGWNWMVANPNATNDANPGACGVYAQGSDQSLLRTNRMWAAAGMLYATGNPTYESAFQSNYVSIEWISSYSKTEAFAASLYLRVPSGANQTTRNAIRQRIFEMADAARSEAASHPFQFATYYYWGCNSNALHRSGQFLWRAYLLDRSRVADRNQALANLEYIFGRNYYRLSYMNGIPGVTNSRMRGFHHWMKALNATPWHYPGALAGGPNEYPDGNDVSYPNAQPFPVYGYWGDPANPRSSSTPVEGRFTDNDSWSTNEIDIAWNAALVYNVHAAKWYAHGESVNTVSHEPTVPMSVHLYQNYPNPFNPSTTIRYDLSTDSFVQLKVYDVFGREVAVLVDGFKRAGEHEVTFDATAGSVTPIASGTYLYRIVADGVTVSRKMLLLR